MPSPTLVGLSPCWAQPLNPFRAHSPRKFHSMIKTMAPKPSPQLALGDAAHHAVPIELVIDDGLAPTIVQHIQTALASPKRPAG